ncbi:GNAT family N-acetyltransferase [Deinococcus roseus]|uniref:N-acetyltransferase n=1 Tax=Deinococcus roseus TaxID=392414 RepID=A0ABQ2DCL4_9DEIO|nr:GNAT family protein [Deinococcus roseus]GGJ51019.1 N-acetyltransferase [Deinococcus roseus]
MTLPQIMPGTEVFLSRLRTEDQPTVYQHINQAEYATYGDAHAQPFALETVEQRYAQRMKDPNRMDFGIFLQGSETLIGRVFLHNISCQQQTATLGVGIFRADQLGKGYGTEAVRLMVEYGMFHLNLYNIDLLVLSDNVRAIRSYQKVGFRILGERQGSAVLGGRRLNDTWMDIIRDEVDLSHLRERYFGGAR